MKTSIVFIFLFIHLADLHAAAEIRGVISMNFERGRPVSGVEVFADGANPTVSGSDGRFHLIFPKGRPGQDIRVSVKNSKLEVVNDILLDTRLPELGATKILEIIVCRQEERERRVFEFFRVRGTENVQSKHLRRLAEIDPADSNASKERLELISQRDIALSQVESLSRQISTTESGSIRGLYRKALNYYLQGDLDKALELLTEENLLRSSNEALQRVQEAISGWLLQGMILSTNYQNEKAELAFKHAIGLDPTSFLGWYIYASFQDNLGRLDPANVSYAKALSIASERAFDLGRASSLYRMSIISIKQNRAEEARHYIIESIDIWRVLFRRNKTYATSLAEALRTVGVLYGHQANNPAARIVLEEALQILRGSNEEGGDDPVKLALVLDSLGMLELEENNIKASRTYLSEAFSMRKKMDRTSDYGREMVATSLVNLGIFYRRTGRINVSITYFYDASLICRDLAKKDSLRYSSFLAKVLSNLGESYAINGDRIQSRRVIEEAFNIQDNFTHEDDYMRLSGLGITLERLGGLNIIDDRSVEAQALLERAEKIYLDLARLWAPEYEHDARRVHKRLQSLSNR